MTTRPVRRRDDRGTVSAETAAVLPVLALVAVALCWAVSLAVTQMRVTDAARETARLLARGDAEAEAVALGRRVAPDGARLTLRRESGAVVVAVSAPVRGPGGVFGSWAGMRVDGEAVAATEEDP